MPGFLYILAGIILFCVYMRLSDTYAENSDMANILLMGWDLLHGNPLLHGWHMSDVSFYPTELVQYALLESLLGLRMSTAHVAAAMTYTLVVLLAVALAGGGQSRPGAWARRLIAAGIMIAPQLSTGVYAVDLAVGHIGTSVPLLLGWLVLDRGQGREQGREQGRWWVPPLLTVILAWGLVADPIVEITGIVPPALVAGLAFIRRLARGQAGWYDAALAASPLVGYAVARAAEAVLRALGGYVLNPLPVQVRGLAKLPAAAPALWKVLDLFGADFQGMSAGLPLLLALAHLVSVPLAAVALGRVAWLAARRRGDSGPPMTDLVLAVGIAANVVLYLGTMASAQGAHEIAVVLPYAAALAGRTLADPLLAGLQRARGPARAWTRTAAAAGGVLLCGYAGGLGWEITFPSAPPANAALASWLLAHGLHSGLAGYWQSSSITADTGGRVRVVPTSGGWMSNAAWYDPARNRATFLILPAPSRQALARQGRQFGRPEHAYLVDGFTVLVWRHNLLRDLRPG
jgi:hypothetical protein